MSAEICRWGAAALFLAGGLGGGLRLGGIFSVRLFFSGVLILFFGAFAGALYRVWRMLPSEEKLLVFLASLVPGGALVLSAAECGDGGHPLPELPPFPRFRCLKRNFYFSLLLAGAVFCGGALLLPVYNRTPEQRQGFDLGDELKSLEEKLACLRTGDRKMRQRAAALQKELEETVREADGTTPGQTYELLHRLNRRMQSELESRAEEEGALLRQLSAVSQAAKALSASGKKAGETESFTRALQALAEKDPRLAEALKKGGFDGSALTSRELEQLAASLKVTSEQVRRALKNMSKYSENASAMSRCETEKAGKELENFLKENIPGCDDLIESLTNRDSGGSGQEGDGSASEGAPGGGRAARGGGSAVLEYSGYTVDYGARYTDRKVTSPESGGKEGSKVLGRFLSEVPSDGKLHTVKGGALRAPSGNRTFHESTIHPAHRRAVRKYFENNRQKK